jgi:hypothetical protein
VPVKEKVKFMLLLAKIVVEKEPNKNRELSESVSQQVWTMESQYESQIKEVQLIEEEGQAISLSKSWFKKIQSSREMETIYT